MRTFFIFVSTTIKNAVSNSLFSLYRELLVKLLRFGKKWNKSLHSFLLLSLGDENPYIQKMQSLARVSHNRVYVIAIVGVHHGETAIQYLENIPNSILIGFEPNELSFKSAKSNLQRFGNRVKLLNKAVGRHQGTGTLKLFSDSGMDSLLSSVTDNAQADQTVEITTLDYELVGYQQVDLLQIDCQGYEGEVFRGMAKCMKEGKIRAILTEGLFENLYSGQSTFFELGVLLQNHFDFRGFTSLKFSGDNSDKLLWADAFFSLRTRETS